MMLVTLELKASKLLNKHKFITQNLIFTFHVILRWNTYTSTGNFADGN